VEQTSPDQRTAEVDVTVEYVAATTPFRRKYPETTVVETVRTDAMAYFGVRDRVERNTYTYYLAFEGQRITNTSQTLQTLLGEHRRGAKFNLIEEIKPGGVL
jgi:hypothetical protein